MSENQVKCLAAYGVCAFRPQLDGQTGNFHHPRVISVHVIMSKLFPLFQNGTTFTPFPQVQPTETLQQSSHTMLGAYWDTGNNLAST